MDESIRAAYETIGKVLNSIMPVQILSHDSDRVSITIAKTDLKLLVSYLAHAKFADEIKSYVLLSPLVNELLRAIIEFSRENEIRGSDASWERVITQEDLSCPGSFARTVVDVIKRDVSEKDVQRALTEALYPNRLGPDVIG